MTASTTPRRSNTPTEDEFAWIHTRQTRSGVSVGVGAVAGAVSACALVRPFSQPPDRDAGADKAPDVAQCLCMCVFNLIGLVAAAAAGDRVSIPSTSLELRGKKDKKLYE